MNNIQVAATPTVYNALLSRIAASTADLQVFANRAYMINAEGSIISGSEVSGSEVAGDTTKTMKGLFTSSLGSATTITYLNNFPSVRVARLRVSNYDSVTGVDTPLVDFVFAEELLTPSWGLYSFSFSINFRLA